MNVFAFLSYTLITAFTPGPNNIMSMEEGQRVGFAKSLYFVAGVFAGFLAVGALCGLATVGMMEMLPEIVLPLKIVGTLYILWLAYKTLTQPPSDQEEGENRFSRRAAFLTGLVLQFVNVKIILYFLTAISGFILPASTNTLFVAAMVLGMCLAGSAANILWAACGSVFRRALKKGSRWLGVVLALLLVYCAVAIWL